MLLVNIFLNYDIIKVFNDNYIVLYFIIIMEYDYD